MTLTLLLYAIGSMVDYIMTVWFIEHGGVEGNPVMAAVINNFGIEWVLVVKILAFLLALCVVKLIYKAAPRAVFFAVYVGALGQWVIVAWNTFWVRVVLEVLNESL